MHGSVVNPRQHDPKPSDERVVVDDMPTLARDEIAQQCVAVNRLGPRRHRPMGVQRCCVVFSLFRLARLAHEPVENSRAHVEVRRRRDARRLVENI